MEIQSHLLRIHEILENHPGDSANWVESVVALCGKNETGLYRELNSKRMWGGAGSIANQSLADNPGFDERTWQLQIREFRELMVDLGKHLQEKGYENPDISSWVLAFSNWNQSDI